MIEEDAAKTHGGLRIELGGAGTPVECRVILGRDTMSLDEQLFAAQVQVPAEPTVLDLPWSRFLPYSRNATESDVLPTNGLIIQSDALPLSGLTVGPVTWLE